MKYSVAFGQLLTTKRVALRTSAPDNRIVYRFGGHALLNPNPEAKPKWISWTPTEQDMKADDWVVLESDGSQVPPPRFTPGTDTTEPRLHATGGRGEGTGWKRG